MHAFTHLDKQQHGTLEFPVEYYYVDHRHPRYQMPFHWHNEWEILRVLDGTFQVYLDDEQYSLGCGDVLLIRGGIFHGGTPSGCVYECLVFDLYGIFRKMDMVKPYLRPFYRQTAIPQCCFPVESDAPLHGIVDGLMAVFRNEDVSPCRELDTVAGLSALFAWIVKQQRFSALPEQEHGENHRMDQIKSVLEYIEAHYSGSISLDDLAGIAGMNPKYFCRVFRSLTHYSPMDYVNFYRIEQAAYLLDSTDLSITEVGAECGFWESSYFTKVFKKYKNLTPQKYRQTIVGSKKERAT